GTPFPALAWDTYAERAYLVPALLGVAGFTTGTRLLTGERGGRVSAELALFLFGLLLFSAALSRPDPTHFVFAAPPVLVVVAGLVEDAVCLVATRTAPLARRVFAAVAVAVVALCLTPYWGRFAENAYYLSGNGPEGRPLQLERSGGILLPDPFAGD